MLYYNILTKDTLDILKAIQSNPFFDGLRLVGGTSLALQYGHRLSIDLDFFGNWTHDTSEIEMELIGLGEFKALKNSKSINVYTLNSVKIDFVDYPYSWLEEAIRTDGLTLAAEKDIAAMKLAAICGRGTKKDFIDLYFLLEHFSIEQIMSYYTQKFPQASIYLVLKSMVYFDDAEHEESPVMLKQVPWAMVKETIICAQARYMEQL